MAAETLVPYVARPSAVMLVSMQGTWVYIYYISYLSIGE